MQSIVDTGCTQTLIWTDLPSQEWAPKADAVWMICMHGQPSTYPQKKYLVEVLSRAKEMPVGLAKDLPYPLILSRDWAKIYQVLDTVRIQEGLTGEETEVPMDADGFDIESLSTSAHFREAEEEEDLFQSTIQSELAKRDGTLQLCVDFRKLNVILKFDAFPMPQINELLERVRQVKFISTLGLTKGYW